VISCEIVILMQADMTGSSPGALFEAVVKLSCEIIEFGWTKDRALVDTFIMRLAAYVRERNDYEEEVFPVAFSLLAHESHAI
jgi:phosphatidylinositol 4-kinase